MNLSKSNSIHPDSAHHKNNRQARQQVRENPYRNANVPFNKYKNQQVRNQNHPSCVGLV